MIKEKRMIYKTLIDLPSGGYGLCNICRFAEWSGSSCDCLDLECHCGIWQVEEEAEDVWSGDDCWAFRPAYSLEDTVDLVGLLLQGETPDMSECKQFIPKRMRLQEV